MSACAEWLWSGYAVKHPDLKIIMSEGGIGWVAMLHDRLENIVDRSGYGHYFPGDLRPAEILHRNFWFSTIDDPSTLSTREIVGVDHITFESDYPHGDGTWPDTQAVFAEVFGGLSARRDREDLARERRPRCSAIRCPRPATPTPSASADLTDGTSARQNPSTHLRQVRKSGFTGTSGTNGPLGGAGWIATGGVGTGGVARCALGAALVVAA